MLNLADCLDDFMRLLPMLALWRHYAVALWHTMRKPVKAPLQICRSPKTCGKPHRLAMVFRRGKPGMFVLVH